jgi:hypothetical protein
MDNFPPEAFDADDEKHWDWSLVHHVCLAPHPCKLHDDNAEFWRRFGQLFVPEWGLPHGNEE